MSVNGHGSGHISFDKKIVKLKIDKIIEYLKDNRCRNISTYNGKDSTDINFTCNLMDDYVFMKKFETDSDVAESGISEYVYQEDSGYSYFRDD